MRGWLLARALLVGAALGGCAAPAAPEPVVDREYVPGEVYEDPLGGFSLTLPAGWIFDSGYAYSGH